jgi:hypothetical protein
MMYTQILYANLSILFRLSESPNNKDSNYQIIVMSIIGKYTNSASIFYRSAVSKEVFATQKEETQA